MNTALGGTLYQDIFRQVESSLGHLPKLLPKKLRLRLSRLLMGLLLLMGRRKRKVTCLY